MAALLTPADVARQWQCSVSHVQRLCRSGQLAAWRIGERGWRISPAAVEAYEARNTTTSAPAPARTQRQEVQPATTPLREWTPPADYEPVFAEEWLRPESTRKPASQRH